MFDKLIYIPNDDTHKITHLEDYNFWLKSLDTQFSEPINQNSIEVTKVVKPTDKKTLS